MLWSTTVWDVSKISILLSTYFYSKSSNLSHWNRCRSLHRNIWSLFSNNEWSKHRYIQWMEHLRQQLGVEARYRPTDEGQGWDGMIFAAHHRFIIELNVNTVKTLNFTNLRSICTTVRMACTCTGSAYRPLSCVSPESRTQTANRLVQPFTNSSRQKVLILYNGRSFPPKLPLPWVIWTPI